MHRESGTIQAIKVQLRNPAIRDTLDELDGIANKTVASLGYFP